MESIITSNVQPKKPNFICCFRFLEKGKAYKTFFHANNRSIFMEKINNFMNSHGNIQFLSCEIMTREEYDRKYKKEGRKDNENGNV